MTTVCKNNMDKSRNNANPTTTQLPTATIRRWERNRYIHASIISLVEKARGLMIFLGKYNFAPNARHNKYNVHRYIGCSLFNQNQAQHQQYQELTPWTRYLIHASTLYLCLNSSSAAKQIQQR